MINYSIIIPHKNIPALLQRCLNSIPRRKDVQIIVADDNSDADKVDFARFPGLNDPFVEVIFGKNENGRNGAGYARNLGLGRAKGKWLIFADADDFFMPCFRDVLDRCKDNENEVIYFYVTSVDFETTEPGIRHIPTNERLDKIRQTDNWDVAFLLFTPWGKIIKRDLVERHNIQFQEVHCANDVLFSAKVTNLSIKKEIISEVVYCISHRRNSLDDTSGLDSVILRFNVVCGASMYLKQYGKDKILHDCVFAYWRSIFLQNKIKSFKYLAECLQTVNGKRRHFRLPFTVT
ncbi:MAG: glycosyltransferase [Dysgonamonadaceae bacterium]|jgi:glycosyltransferase involved in cell wall biosynthesis|nr:glycosyltransferase [Dysgonamonadaceae bacterium]